MVKLNSMCIPLTYQELCDGEKPDIGMLKSSLAKLDKQTLLKCVLTLLHNADSWSDINEFVTNFFSKENEELASEVLRRYTDKISEHYTSFNGLVPQMSVLSKHSCLELLRIVFSICFTGDNISDNKTFQLEIFKCLLVLNEITTQTPNFPAQIDEDLKIAYCVLLNLLSYNDFTNMDAKANFIVQCYKSKLLFDFLESQGDLTRMRDMYLEEMGCSCWEEYVLVLAKLFVLNCQNGLPNTCIVLDENNPSFQHEKVLLDQFAISSSEKIPYDENVDFILFRNRPLIRFGTNTYWVIDENFLANRLYRSIVFGIKKKNDSMEKQERLADFFQSFTTNFSEEKLFYDVMRHIVGKRSYLHYSGKEIRERKKMELSGEPDYYIRNGNDIFLFEFKDSLFRKEDKVECNYENVKSSIVEKLVRKRNGNPSAIEQLCNNIELILSGEFQIDLGFRPDKVRIYPILVVGDSSFTNIGVNFILNDYFKKELSDRGMENIKIRPLVLVSIDSLILYQFDFEDKYLKLRGVLDKYLRFLDLEKPYPCGEKYLIQNAMHKYFSLDQFLMDKIPRMSTTSHLDSLIDSIREKGLK